jgi:hypothetical protein
MRYFPYGCPDPAFIHYFYCKDNHDFVYMFFNIVRREIPYAYSYLVFKIIMNWTRRFHSGRIDLDFRRNLYSHSFVLTQRLSSLKTNRVRKSKLAFTIYSMTLSFKNPKAFLD